MDSALDYKNKGYIWMPILFFIWPFLSFLTALFNFQNRSYRIYIYLFFIYYGLTYVISNSQSDANRYYSQFQDWRFNEWKDYTQVVSDIYFGENKQYITDPLIVSIYYFVSRITQSQFALFGIFSLLFSVVYLKSIEKLYEYKQTENNYIIGFYLLFFSFVVSIIQITGFRFWFAAWIFFFGSYYFLTELDKQDRIKPKYILIFLCSGLVHFSFFLVSSLLVIYWLLGNKNWFYYGILIISFFVTVDLSGLFKVAEEQTPKSFAMKSSGYASEDYIQKYAQYRANDKWFIRIPFSFYFAKVAVLYTRVVYPLKILSKGTQNLFSFLLIFFSFINFAGDFSQLVRFRSVFILFVLAFLVRVFKELHKSKVSFFELLALIPFLITLALNFRIGSDSFNMFLFSPLLLGFFQNEMALTDFIFK